MSRGTLLAVAIGVVTFAAVLAVVAFIPSKSRIADEPDAPPRVVAVRAVFARLPADILGVSATAQVVDGGVSDAGIFVRLEGANGATVDFATERRAEKASGGRSIYIGTRRAGDPEAPRAVLRGAEEAALYGALIRASGGRHDGGPGAEAVRLFLEVLDRRFSAPPRRAGEGERRR